MSNESPTAKEIAAAIRDGSFKSRLEPISDAPAGPLKTLGITDDETFNAIVRKVNKLTDERDAARAREAALRDALGRIDGNACAYAGSYDSCAEATDDADYEGPCPRCIARAALSANPVSP